MYYIHVHVPGLCMHEDVVLEAITLTVTLEWLGYNITLS